MELIRTLRGGHEKPVSALRLSPDQTQLASVAGDGNLCVWNVNGELASQISLGTGLNEVAWSLNHRLAVVGDNGLVHLVSHGNSVSSAKDEGHINYAFCVAWNPSGTLLASGSFDESVRLWAVTPSGLKFIRCLPAHSDPVSTVGFSPDGSLLVTGSFDGLIRLWDHASGQCVRTIVDDDNPPVAAVQFTPNGQYLLVATLDSTLRLWSIAPGPLQGKCIKAYTGHVNKQYCVMPILRSQSILAASEDGRIIEWDLNTRQIINEHALVSNSPVLSMALLGEDCLFTAQLDSPDISLWRLSTKA